MHVEGWIMAGTFDLKVDYLTTPCVVGTRVVISNEVELYDWELMLPVLLEECGLGGVFRVVRDPVMRARFIRAHHDAQRGATPSSISTSPVRSVLLQATCSGDQLAVDDQIAGASNVTRFAWCDIDYEQRSSSPPPSAHSPPQLSIFTKRQWHEFCAHVKECNRRDAAAPPLTLLMSIRNVPEVVVNSVFPHTSPAICCAATAIPSASPIAVMPTAHQPPTPVAVGSHSFTSFTPRDFMPSTPPPPQSTQQQHQWFQFNASSRTTVNNYNSMGTYSAGYSAAATTTTAAARPSSTRSHQSYSSSSAHTPLGARPRDRCRHHGGPNDTCEQCGMKQAKWWAGRSLGAVCGQCRSHHQGQGRSFTVYEWWRR